MTNLLIALLVLAGAGLLLKKKSLQSERSENAQPVTRPNADTAPPAPQPEADPQLAQPSAANVGKPQAVPQTPQPQIGSDVISTMKQMGLDKATGPQPFKQEDLPPEVQAIVAETQKRINNELATEASARQAIDEISACLKSAGMGATDGMPPEMQQQMSQLANSMRSDCERRGKRLLEKYPSLKSEYDSKVNN